MASRLSAAPSPDMGGLTQEVAALREEVRALASTSTPIIPPMPVPTSVRPAFEIDLFADEEPPMDRGKRPHSPEDQGPSDAEYETDLRRAVKASQVEYQAIHIEADQRARGASASQSVPPPDAPSTTQVDNPAAGGPTFGA